MKINNEVNMKRNPMLINQMLIVFAIVASATPTIVTDTIKRTKTIAVFFRFVFCITDFFSVLVVFGFAKIIT